jgi:hypothetical protein
MIDKVIKNNEEREKNLVVNISIVKNIKLDVANSMFVVLSINHALKKVKQDL